VLLWKRIPMSQAPLQKRNPTERRPLGGWVIVATDLRRRLSMAREVTSPARSFIEQVTLLHPRCICPLTTEPFAITEISHGNAPSPLCSGRRTGAELLARR